MDIYYYIFLKFKPLGEREIFRSAGIYFYSGLIEIDN